jgi:hypothetical protein
MCALAARRLHCHLALPSLRHSATTTGAYFLPASISICSKPISAQAYGASGMPTGLQGSLAKFITCISDTDLTQLMQGLHKALDNVKAGHTSLPASRLQVHAVCRIFQAARSAQSSS